MSVALVAMPGAGGTRLARLVARLPFPHVIMVPDLIGISSLWVTSRDLAGLLGLEVKKNLLQRENWIAKRAMDYLITAPLLLLTLPLLGLLMIWIKAVSPGPALFRHRRIGFGGRQFDIYKLRTMHLDAEERLERHLQVDPSAYSQWVRFCKLKDDPRVLPVIGRLLRRTSLDELPQLFNVLRGEMSLVGPRPFPAYHLEKFSPEFRTLRRRVLPGLTGLWQISARSEGDLDVQERLDTYYVRNWSIWLDIYILARTFLAVVSSRGAY